MSPRRVAGSALDASERRLFIGSAIENADGTATFPLFRGTSHGQIVWFIVVDDSDGNVTLALLINHAPFVGGDGTNSARASLAACINGQTGASNPERQGLNSAPLDGLDPLNVLFWSPNQGRYSPLWDVHAAAWTSRIVASGENVRQTNFGQILNLAHDGSTVQEIYAAFGRGDIPAILDKLADDVDWDYAYRSAPNPIPWLQPQRGRTGVGGFFKSVQGQLGNPPICGQCAGCISGDVWPRSSSTTVKRAMRH